MYKFIALLIVLTLSYMSTIPHAKATTIDDSESTQGQTVPGTYTVVLKNETFAAVDAEFPDKAVVTENNDPQINAQLNPELQQEYEAQTAEIVYDNVQKYNGTGIENEVTPLGEQGATVNQVYIHAIRGYQVIGVDNPLIFVGDPAIQSVEPASQGQVETQYIPLGVARIGSLIAATQQYRPQGTEQTLGVDVAVIDEAIEPGHPDLNLINTVSFLPSTKVAEPKDHGTHVAGIVGARDNLAGVVGVAPGARLYSMTVCGNTISTGTLSCSGMLSAWDYITANAATFEVATMSIGCSVPEFSTIDCHLSGAEITAVNNMIAAGVTFVLAAGNEARSSDNMWCGDVPNAICVSALDDRDGLCGGLVVTNGIRDDKRASFSNFGTSVDIMAPGVNILSTVPFIDSTQTLPYIGTSEHGDYAGKSGTSMAAPHVAGASALVKLSNPTFTPAQVKTALLNAAYSQTTTCDGQFKGGLVTNPNTESSEPILWVAPF